MFKKILALHTGGTISDGGRLWDTNEANPMTQVTSPPEWDSTSEDLFNLPSLK